LTRKEEEEEEEGWGGGEYDFTKYKIEDEK
jgi:hypothetical protein